jgi:hypothetical protein
MILSAMAISPMILSNAHAQEEVLNTENNKALDLAGALGEEDADGLDNASVMVTQANTYYVGTNGLRVRSTPEDAGKTLGLLSLNEKVRLVTGELINGKYVEVEIIRTVNPMVKSEKYYVVRDHLSEKVVDYKEFAGKYYAVVNVATETLRIYERACLDNSCPSKMVMETEVVVGEDINLAKEEKGKGRSILGSYRVTGWAKFYQDAGGHYPAWYRDGSPDLPEVGAGFNKWFKNRFMPLNAEGKADGKMRGAFGWYAAFVGPNPYGQWTHGTIGWGEDKEEYIKKTKKFVTNVVSNPRSSGCTRNNNEAIAFIRQILDTGAPIVKIYAKEALLDPSLSSYNGAVKTWSYILTKKAGQRSDRAEVLASLGVSGSEANMYWAAKRNGNDMIVDPKSPLNQILEVGTYTLDTVPTPITYTPGEKMGKIKASVGRKGNVYGIDTKDMSAGTYYVDAGILDGYHHPRVKLDFSGFEDEETPPWMDIRNLNR